ncbi:methyltransferase [Nocardia sp. KC 131]|uniref:methyltransferase n=1 Tax=Nocardia arseniciresistens TaxID=3392119 RepID=UPI00398E7EB0
MTGLKSARQLIDMADMVRPSALRAAATLRIADHIAAGTATPAALASRTNSRPDVMELLLDYLVELDVLSGNTIEGFALTELGQALRDEHPALVRSSLTMDGLIGRSDAALINVLHTIRTGEPCHASVFGQSYWDSVNEDPSFQDAFTPRRYDGLDALGWDTAMIVNDYDWSAVRHVVDVGGNTGVILTELAKHHTHLQGTLLDLKNAATVAADTFAANGLNDRCEAVVGSFFDPLPSGADVYLLSAILADWGDEDAIAILRRCAEAAGPQGKVLVADVNLVLPGAGQRLWIRATMPTPVRTVTELKALGAAAGLRVTFEGPVTPVRSLLEFSPTAAGSAE